MEFLFIVACLLAVASAVGGAAAARLSGWRRFVDPDAGGWQPTEADVDLLDSAATVETEYGDAN